ncbi:MAG: anti-sigma factor family protein [Candidatus Zipacnadales bacterium]
MDCASLEEYLCAYVDNELDLCERLRVENHVLECPRCAEELDSLRLTKALVSRLRLYEEEVPSSIRTMVESRAVWLPKLVWWRLCQPISMRSIAVAVGVVLVVLLASWQQYSAHYSRNMQRQAAIMVHLQGLASVLPKPPGPAMNVALRPVDDQVYAHLRGPASFGTLSGYQTIYFMGAYAVSQLRLAAGKFDDTGFARVFVGGREYRVGEYKDHSLATYRRGPYQIVLVSETSPKVLIALAQNIPPDTPFSPSDIGY